MSKIRACCFTINFNNVDDAERFWLCRYEVGTDPDTGDNPIDPRVVFLVYQLEEGEQKRPHIQGYVYFRNALSMGSYGEAKREQVGIKGFLKCNHAHLEKARGTPQENKDYCTKEEGRIKGPWIFGVMPEQGKRNDAIEVFDLIKQGASNYEIVSQFPGYFMRYGHGIQAARNALPPEGRKKHFSIIWLWGESGSQKTTWAWKQLKRLALTISISNENQTFINNYTNERVLFIDEFGGAIPGRIFNKICDQFNGCVDIKGSATILQHWLLIITSILPPVSYYTGTAHKDEFDRRIEQFGHVMQFPQENIQFIEEIQGIGWIKDYINDEGKEEYFEYMRDAETEVDEDVQIANAFAAMRAEDEEMRRREESEHKYPDEEDDM